MTVDQIDWEYLLSFDPVPSDSLDDLFFDAGETSTPEFAEGTPVDGVPHLAAGAEVDEKAPSWIGDIESFLMQDEDGHGDDVQIQCGDLLESLDSPAASDSQPSPPPPVPVDGEKDSSDSKDDNSDSARERAEIDADCTLSKQQLRQLRNRDAALRSRERKKAYVKELEMKSRYLEAECRKLDRLLQCCYAENQMLRSYQCATAFSGYAAKAESAVLLLESLLLGSLLWSLVSVWLLHPTKGVASPENAESRDQVTPPLRSRGGKSQLRLQQLFLSRRCVSSRTKMKAAQMPMPSFELFDGGGSGLVSLEPMRGRRVISWCC